MFKSASDNCCIVKCSSEIINEFANGLKQYTSMQLYAICRQKSFDYLGLLDRVYKSVWDLP